MEINTVKQQIATSPAFVLDKTHVINTLAQLKKLRQESGCKILYSIKSLPLAAVLNSIKPYVDGFSTSSLFESQLAHEVLAGTGTVHLTSPGIRADEMEALGKLCSHISLNSLSQHERLACHLQNNASVGLRINPKLSFVKDERYNPCRPYSKLGVDLDLLWQSSNLDDLQGLHIHTMFAATDYTPLTQTLDKLILYFGKKLAKLEWLNLGGGYLYNQIDKQQPFIDLVAHLKTNYGVEVFIEPGNAVVNRAGYLLTTVIDLMTSDGKTIAILDTSVNHHPEVFEYQIQPELHEHAPEGKHQVILAGSTCLAGDLFGEYRFKEPLNLGDRLVFKNVGAYSLVKANRFNGYNLPDIYTLTSTGLKLVKSYDYQDYRKQWW